MYLTDMTAAFTKPIPRVHQTGRTRRQQGSTNSTQANDGRNNVQYLQSTSQRAAVWYCTQVLPLCAWTNEGMP